MNRLMKFALVLMFLFVAAPKGLAQGAGYTLVTGTLLPYAGGTVSAAYVNQSTVVALPTLNGSVFPQTGVTSFNSSGVFGFYLADNNVIAPGPSQWKITVCAKSGNNIPCYPVMVTITGASQDITAQISGAPPIPGAACLLAGGSSCLMAGPITLPADPTLALQVATKQYVDGSQLGIVKATNYPGSDILAQVIAAFASCSSSCTVYVPPGNYPNVTTTLELNPVSVGGKTLMFDNAAVINYTGTGWAVKATSNCGSTDSGLTIVGGQIHGTSAGLGGVQFSAFNGAKIDGLRIYGFTNGDGFNNNGANSVDIYASHFTGNKNGLHETTFSGCGPTTHMYGGGLEFNSSWGVLSEDVQASSGDVYSGVNFVGNGGTGATGNVLEFHAIKNLFSGCYFEEVAGSTNPYSVVIGDVTNATAFTSGVTITDSVFYSAGTHTASIFNNGTSSSIRANWEGGSPTYFVNQGTQELRAVISENNGFWSSSVWGGADNDSITVLENNSGASPVPLLNSYAPSMMGVGFSGITGQPGQDFRLGCLSSATYATRWYSLSFVNLLGYMDCSGNLQAKTSVAVGTAKWTSGAGVPAATCNVGDEYSNTTAASASTVKYLCYPVNTWNAITVP